MDRRLLPLLSASVLLTACAIQPRELQGNFAPINQAQATTPDAVGDRVRWGGEVVGVRDVGAASCLEIRAYRLASSSLRPVEPRREPGYVGPQAARFLACSRDTFSAELGKPGAIITFIGQVTPPQYVSVERDRCVDGGSYRNTLHANDAKTCIVALATLDVDDSYLWPFRAQMLSDAGPGGGGGSGYNGYSQN